jgi:nitrite reductase/ring-hydroxylating ferredoxin subunit
VISVSDILPANAIFLCKAEDIAEGKSKGFNPENHREDTLFIVRKQDAYFAYVNSCPHIPETNLEWKQDQFLTEDDDPKIYCSGHGAIFNIEDGECVLGACLGDKLTPANVIRHQDDLYYIPIEN